MNHNFIRLIRRLGGVKRLHAFRTIFQQDVQGHSYNVAMLLFEFHRALINQNIESDLCYLLLRGLLHDFPEVAGGDIPAPFKRQLELAGVDFKVQENKALRSDGYSCSDDGTAAYIFGSNEKPLEEQLLKLADILELLMTCVDEAEGGNGGLSEVYTKAARWSKARFQALPPEVREALLAVPVVAMAVSIPSVLDMNAN